MTYSAVICDLDGTLLATESLTLDASLCVFEELGHPVSREFLLGLVGKDWSTCRKIIRRDVPKLDLSLLETRWEAEEKAILSSAIPLRPTVEHFLKHVAQSGMPLGIATSSQHGSATKKLANTGLTSHVQTVVTADCVTRRKPAPDPYLLAAERLGVDPKRCIAFEDTDTGALSAYSAGMTVVQIPDLIDVSGTHAHHVADTLMIGAQQAGLFQL